MFEYGFNFGEAKSHLITLSAQSLNKQWNGESPGTQRPSGTRIVTLSCQRRSSTENLIKPCDCIHSSTQLFVPTSCSASTAHFSDVVDVIGKQSNQSVASATEWSTHLIGTQPHSKACAFHCTTISVQHLMHFLKMCFGTMGMPMGLLFSITVTSVGLDLGWKPSIVLCSLQGASSLHNPFTMMNTMRTVFLSCTLASVPSSKMALWCQFATCSGPHVASFSLTFAQGCNVLHHAPWKQQCKAHHGALQSKWYNHKWIPENKMSGKSKTSSTPLTNANSIHDAVHTIFHNTPSFAHFHNFRQNALQRLFNIGLLLTTMKDRVWFQLHLPTWSQNSRSSRRTWTTSQMQIKSIIEDHFQATKAMIICLCQCGHSCTLHQPKSVHCVGRKWQ